jgi:hypothetical protein
VVPQRDRRPRPIVDYSYSGVNDGTISVAPDSIQFGNTFNRFLQRLERADTRRGPIYLAKTDISDAFMRVWISLDTIPSLGALLPIYQGEEPLVAFPLILPMGWVDSPNYLCAVTETAADLANARFTANDLSTSQHRLAGLASTKPPTDVPGPTLLPTIESLCAPQPRTRSNGPLQPHLNYVDVYMDDFLHATQLPSPAREQARDTLFECIDQLLRPLSPNDNPSRKEPISTKKLQKGDAAWATSKTILGWAIDTIHRTIALPPHRLERLINLLHSFPHHQRRTSRRKWQQLLGELRSMVLAIPGGRGLFSQLQTVLTTPTNPRPSDRLRLGPAVHDQLDDIRWIASNLGSRPTRWAEVVDSTPTFLGTVDASGTGMGGVWIPANKHLPPLLWRHAFGISVSNSLVSSHNHAGTITNSDLEQLAVIAHADVLAQTYDIRENTIGSLSDNTAAVSREQRGSTTTSEAAAYLCRLASIHQRSHRYRQKIAYLPGPLNIMADDLSRRWDLSDTDLLAYFDSTYPQVKPWRLCRLKPEMHSALMLALWKVRCDPESLMVAALQPTLTGQSGPRFVNNMHWHPTSPKDPVQSPGYRYSRSEYETAGFPPPVTLSELERWQTPSPLLRRRTQWLASPTRAA